MILTDLLLQHLGHLLLQIQFMGMILRQEAEVDFTDPNAIAVMAVDNLPNELPRDASQGFSENFVKHVIPAFFNGDEDGVLQEQE